LAVSQAIGPIVGLTLLDFVGFQWAFRISALVIVGGLILACLIKEPGNHVRKPYQLKLDRMFSKGAVIPALMIALLSIPFSCINAFIVIYGNLLGIGGMGAYFAVYAGCLLATRPLFGSLSDKHGVQRIIPIGLCFFVASILVLTLASNLPLFLLAAAVGACGYGAVIPLLQSLGFLCSPYDSRGAASNTTFLGLDAGNLVGPTIGGMIVSLFIASGLSEAQSYNGMFFVLIVPVLIAFIVFLMARKSVMRPAK
jgi:MFS family permease